MFQEYLLLLKFVAQDFALNQQRMLPTMDSLMFTGSMPALEIASRAAITPRLNAKLGQLPLKFPTGVRAADTITTLLLLIFFVCFIFTK